MKTLMTLLLAVSLLAAVPVEAAPVRKAVSLDQIVNRVYAQGNRKVISARTVGKGQNRVHEVKTLSKDGRLRNERYNARTGRRMR